MKNDKLQKVDAGDPIKASLMNDVLKSIKQFQGFFKGFASGDTIVTRMSLLHPAYRLEKCSDPSDFIIVSNYLANQINKVVKVAGVCYTVKNLKKIDCRSGICVTIEGEYDDCDGCGGVSTCWLFTPCSAGTAFILRGAEFGDYSGKVVEWTDGNCYTVSASSCVGAVSGDPNDVQALFGDCADCGKCTRLLKCPDFVTPRYVRTDQISGFPDLVVGKIVELNGVCYKIDNVDFTCPSTPEDLGGIHQGPYYADCNTCGCHKFEDCDTPGSFKWVKSALHETEPAVFVEFDLESLRAKTTDENGEIVREGTGTCWEYLGRVQDLVECPNAVELTIQEVYDSCSCCTAYQLTESPSNCSTPTGTITVNSDLCDYITTDFLVGAEAAFDGKCYTLITPVAFSPGDVKFTVEAVHKVCEQCHDPKYVLNDAGCLTEACGDCGGGGAISEIITDEDLNDAVGQIIKHEGVCYEVAAGDDLTGAVTDAAPFQYTGPWSDCEPCVMEPSCLTVVTDIDWVNKKVMKSTLSVAASKCSETEDTIPTAPCTP